MADSGAKILHMSLYERRADLIDALIQKQSASLSPPHQTGRSGTRLTETDRRANKTRIYELGCEWTGRQQGDTKGVENKHQVVSNTSTVNTKRMGFKYIHSKYKMDGF
jgi:hypothetical protein